MKFSRASQKLLHCPICQGKLVLTDQRLVCNKSECNTQFPIVDGIPILLNEASSVFSIEDFLDHRDTFFYNSRRNEFKEVLRRLMPSITANIRSKENYEKFNRTLLERSGPQRVLVLGGSILGQGMEGLASDSSIELVESDISFGPRTMLICDAHDIPFEDESFDGVIIQAVLEHVADPYRCVAEAYRVLKSHGIVYSETPFIQQVHGGRYDFTRFTHLGHRRLFRNFEEIDSGAACGPGTALAWSYQYFLLSFTSLKLIRQLITLFSTLTAFYLKYFDYYLVDKPGSLDAASGYYFMGKKVDYVLSDRELVKLYKGLF